MRTLLSEPKIVVVIPAHLASVRFAKKILFPFAGYPMIEHVRRRALPQVDLGTQHAEQPRAVLCPAVEEGPVRQHRVVYGQRQRFCSPLHVLAEHSVAGILVAVTRRDEALTLARTRAARRP